MNKKLVICSIDIGLINFCVYIEKIPLLALVNIRDDFLKIKKEFRKATFNEHTKDIIRRICSCGETWYTSVNALVSCGTKYDNTVRTSIINHLNTIKKYLSLCDIFLIEQQYVNPRIKGSSNFIAMKVAEVTATYIQINFPHAYIFDFPSRFKTLCFGSDAKTKIERKKFTTKYTKKILHSRDGNMDCLLWMIFDIHKKTRRKRKNLEEWLSPFEDSPPFIKNLSRKVIIKRQKVCDISDAITQCQAFKFKKLIANID